MRDFFWHQYLRFWTREPICGRMIFGDDIKMTLSRKKKCFFICSLNSLRILDWLKHLQASESEHWYNIFLKGWNKRFCRVSDPLTFWQTDSSPQTSTYTTSQPTASAPGWVFILGLLLFYFSLSSFSHFLYCQGRKRGMGTVCSYCSYLLPRYALVKMLGLKKKDKENLLTSGEQSINQMFWSRSDGCCRPLINLCSAWALPKFTAQDQNLPQGSARDGSVRLLMSSWCNDVSASVWMTFSS